MGFLWFIIWIIAGFVAAADATEKGKSGVLAFLLVFIGGPIGIIIWLLIRNNA